MRRLLLAAIGCTFTLPAAARGVPEITLSPIGVYESGLFDQGSAEIPSFDVFSRRVFVVNAGDASLDVLDLRNPAQPVRIAQIELGNAGLGAPNSVATKFGLVAVALQADDKTQPGRVAIYSAFTLRLLATVPAGALPDMVAFSPSGRYLVAANEGEPNSDYTVDPEGSITIIDLWRFGRAGFVRTADFSRFNSDAERTKLIEAGVRIYGPNASVAQDLEPEYITMPDDQTAFVTLQENNAIAVVDLRNAKVEKILALGLKDHSLAGNELDASDRDSAIAIENWPVFGMYEPDAIDSFKVGGKRYLITANEGDARDYTGFAEEIRIGSSGYRLDPTIFPPDVAAALKQNTAIGRLNATRFSGDIDGDGDFDRIQVLGGRSFTIWSDEGELVYDSGSLLEQITAEAYPDFFNASNTDNSRDSRSDNKGPEPEGVVVGEVAGRPYAFIGLERIGGIAVFDLSNPKAPLFKTYVNRRDFTQTPSLNDDEEASNPAAGDLGPEGLEFVPAWASPSRKPLLIVGNEISGTTTVWEIRVDR